MLPRPPRSTLFPYTTLFRSVEQRAVRQEHRIEQHDEAEAERHPFPAAEPDDARFAVLAAQHRVGPAAEHHVLGAQQDRKSTRLNSSHPSISYAVFCVKKKKNTRGVLLGHGDNGTKVGRAQFLLRSTSHGRGGCAATRVMLAVRHGEADGGLLVLEAFL